ncbi:hypothetical protein EBR43_09650, partial [bacterium]|nr:hypothetical protein [bacterium]
MRQVNIKGLNEFENINEGFFSSLFGGIKDFFTSKKGKIEAILKKIREARHEEVTNTISIEKEIQEYESDAIYIRDFYSGFREMSVEEYKKII